MSDKKQLNKLFTSNIFPFLYLINETFNLYYELDDEN